MKIAFFLLLVIVAIVYIVTGIMKSIRDAVRSSNEDKEE